MHRFSRLFTKPLNRPASKIFEGRNLSRSLSTGYYSRPSSRSSTNGLLLLTVGFSMTLATINNSNKSDCFFFSKPKVDYSNLKKRITEAINADEEKRGDGTSMYEYDSS
jgi:hypothetical protein